MVKYQVAINNDKTNIFELFGKKTMRIPVSNEVVKFCISGDTEQRFE